MTFAAADFEQTDGAAEIAPRTRECFRLSQREGPDRVCFVWKDVQDAAQGRMPVGDRERSG